jgi:hypothetical protein
VAQFRLFVPGQTRVAFSHFSDRVFIAEPVCLPYTSGCDRRLDSYAIVHICTRIELVSALRGWR